MSKSRRKHLIRRISSKFYKKQANKYIRRIKIDQCILNKRFYQKLYNSYRITDQVCV